MKICMWRDKKKTHTSLIYQYVIMGEQHGKPPSAALSVYLNAAQRHQTRNLYILKQKAVDQMCTKTQEN